MEIIFSFVFCLLKRLPSFVGWIYFIYPGLKILRNRRYDAVTHDFITKILCDSLPYSVGLDRKLLHLILNTYGLTEDQVNCYILRLYSR